MTPLKMGELFAGYGGLGSLGIGSVLPVEPAWFVEFDAAPSKILAHHWPDVPNYGDITQVDWSQVEPVDVLTGGFPCQDVSHAGRRAGLIRDGEGRTRSGLWGHMLRAITELRPRLVVAENVRGLLSAKADSDMEPCPWCVGGAGAGEPAMRALGAVLADLADVGYDAAWYGLRAADVGAAHGRFRVFIFAWPAGTTPDADHARRQAGRRPESGIDPQLTDAAVNHGNPGLPGRGLGADRHDWERRSPGRGEREAQGVSLTLLPVNLLPTPGADNSRGLPQHGTDFQSLPNEVIHRWGDYAPAIARWEAVIGRPAPDPTEPGPKGNPRLSAAFVEWLMGLPAGHVTDVPGLTRNHQLKALGNGVVPQQSAAAARAFLSDFARMKQTA